MPRRPLLRAAASLLLTLVPGLAPAASVPTSPRSREVERRARPALDEALAARGLTLGAPVFLRIFKEPGELELWVQGKDERFELFRTYAICRYSGKLGPKQKEGDLQAPEGFYRVAARQMNPASRFHLSFDLGYPNAYDRAHARTGSALMVHGACVSIGCYAMTDAGIEEIWTLCAAALRGGQAAFEVHAFPFRLTAEALSAQRGSEWFDFWTNLKQGYDLFEAEHRPPHTRVRGKRYVLGAP